MPEFGHKIKDKTRTRLLEQVPSVLLPGEELVWVSSCNNMRPMANFLLVTNLRVLAWGNGHGMTFEADFGPGFTVESQPDKQTLTVTSGERHMKFKLVPKPDFEELIQHVSNAQSSADIGVTKHVRSTASESSVSASTQLRASRGEWPNAKVIGKLSGKASKAVGRLCHGHEEPWLIVVASGGAGLVAAWEDRLAIVKTGGMTSLMAGSLGGERSAVFHFVDITGIEYNSGFVNGVLEVLTPSYSGGANKDFWRGSASPRNANSNDPWTLSNTLPLAKAEYNAAQREIQKLRAKISEAKRPVINVTHPVAQPAPVPSSGGIADELRKLAELKDAGVLNEEEFQFAKRRIISG